MVENTKNSNKVFFWLELVLAVIIPFIIIWIFTPTNVLNSNSPFKLLETTGIYGSALVFFAGIPVGIIGIIKAKRTGKLRIATVALSILNLSAGIIVFGIQIAVFCAVVFGGVSV